MSSWRLLAVLVVLATQQATSARSGRCPALQEWGVCVSSPVDCEQDADCPGSVEKCCVSACGKTCVKPLYTGCEQLSMEAQRRARSLPPADARNVLIPACTSSGQFDAVQCSPSSTHCWCVDAAGFEVAGTRAPARALVDCSARAACSAHTCRMLCPHGFELDEDGCPMCQCRDPCQGVKCPGKLQCQLEDVACAEKPCPPVPKCKRGRSLENVCPAGLPLRVTDSERPFLCGTSPGKPRCPPMFQCLVQPHNDYGVCCPAAFNVQKPGACPAHVDEDACGTACQTDLECPSMEKCCGSEVCGKHCSQPQNVTACLQQKMLADLLVMNEREGKGYVPQCHPTTGQFESKQCSRNGLVCWCVDSAGNKLRGSMGQGSKVSCHKAAEVKAKGRGFASDQDACDRQLCAQMCEYGFKVDAGGCPTCECDDPCDGYSCPAGEQCRAMRTEGCTDFLCPMYPVCEPVARTETAINPCAVGSPLHDPTDDHVVNCDDGEEHSDSACPKSHRCTYIAATGQAVCCPKLEAVELTKAGMCPILTLSSCHNTTVCVSDEGCEAQRKCCFTAACGAVCADPLEAAVTTPQPEESDAPTMCEYLRDFNEKMEGTQDGMGLAMRAPTCHPNGSYVEIQCAGEACWCVDSFGTEIPKTRNMSVSECVALRTDLECLDLTCRLGCDYGFVLDPDTQCPLCECRNPCESVACGDAEECQMVDVNCENEYCSPVPACLPRKAGQCPYLVPVDSGTCDYECKYDYSCNGTHKCCSNGCGTQCVEPVTRTACQHLRAVALHKASEKGVPANQLYVPACRETDGLFEAVQCHAGTRQCWCVDEQGQEKPGTRAPPDVQPSCHAPSECPLRKCKSTCAAGYRLDAAGCPMCECADPCADMSCRGDGEACRLVEVDCVDRPCPPIPMCLPRRENPCVGGHPLLAPGSTDLVTCGPNGTECPTSHKCLLSPVGEYAVCCPKPREVCFEPKEVGICRMAAERWYFNPAANQCEKFIYGGCAGNQNNFDSESTCNTVCPVLSQCERLREKNAKAAAQYQQATFTPRCDSETGHWAPVQCLEHVGMCWCVNRDGQPVKGSLTRGEPVCNFRQARRRMGGDDHDLDAISELMREEYHELSVFPALPLKTRCHSLRHEMAAAHAHHVVDCDAEGRFSPTQCLPRPSDTHAECWCVDEAGNQLPNSTTFTRGANICLPTPIEAVEVQLGFHGDFTKLPAQRLEQRVADMLARLGARVRDQVIHVDSQPERTTVVFALVGSGKVDVAYHLEEMVKSEQLHLRVDPELRPLTADITNSRFTQRLLADNDNEPHKISENMIALEHREVVSESTVSLITPYQTAIIILFVASAFIICILVVVIMLYRRKMAAASAEDGLSQKAVGLNERFLDYNQPIYVVSIPPKGEERVEQLLTIPTALPNDYETLKRNLNNVLTENTAQNDAT